MAFANFSISDNHRSGVMQPLILILSLVVVWLSSVAAPVNSDPAQVSFTNPLAYLKWGGEPVHSNPAQARPPALDRQRGRCMWGIYPAFWSFCASTGSTSSSRSPQSFGWGQSASLSPIQPHALPPSQPHLGPGRSHKGGPPKMFTVKKSPEAAVLFRSDLWSFSENSSKFETPVIPYISCDQFSNPPHLLSHQLLPLPTLSTMSTPPHHRGWHIPHPQPACLQWWWENAGSTEEHVSGMNRDILLQQAWPMTP